MSVDAQHPVRHWRRLATLGTALAAALTFVACQSVQTTNSGAVGITRSQSMAVSAAEIDQASAKEYNQMVAGARQQGGLSTNTALVNRVRTISNRLIAQVGAFRPDAQKWKWEVNVFKSDEVNAFCMAGGKIGVYEGLINKLKPTDDELAAVIGHEISHALREHVREQVSRQVATSMATQLGVQVLGAATGNSALGQLGQQLGPMVMDAMFTLPNSRTAELEADKMGMELAARAGYNPRAAISLWQKMTKLSESRPPEFLSTHPAPETRMGEMEQTVRMVEPLYKKR